MAKLSRELTEWLNHTVYPRLSHELVFGDLPGFTLAQSGASWYADCPYCQRKGVFYMLPNRQVGQCKSCQRTIGWFGYLRRHLNGDPAAVRKIAALAGIAPLAGYEDQEEMIPAPETGALGARFFVSDPLVEPDDVPSDESDDVTPGWGKG